jgi:hypothetical protein
MQNRQLQNIKSEIAHQLWMAIVLCLLILPISTQAQTDKYTQLCNELQFARAINDKWAGELWLGGAFSNTPYESQVLKTNIQRYFFLWAHYYYSPKWKLSASFTYYYNKDVPDIGQYYSPEYRLSPQGIYFFHKTGYTLSTRLRGEFRYLMNADSVFEFKVRYRQMLKYVKPLNSKVLRGGVVYFVAQEEILIKPEAKTKGINFFDRNRFEIGGGYLITDDLQVEAMYLNEFVPRDNGNTVYNALELTYNNLFPRLKDKIQKRVTEND